MSLQKLNYKKRLVEIATNILKERISISSKAVENAQSSANEEEKSSAGDKYETSRAMSHIEKDMYAKQVASNKNDLAELLSIDSLKLHTSILPGTVIKCRDCSFFIAAGLGKISFEEETVYLLSPKAPLAQILFQKKKGDSIVFNNNTLLILDVY